MMVKALLLVLETTAAIKVKNREVDHTPPGILNTNRAVNILAKTDNSRANMVAATTNLLIPAQVVAVEDIRDRADETMATIVVVDKRISDARK